MAKTAFKKAAGNENNKRIREMPINFDGNLLEIHYSENLKDVVLKLLNRDPTERIGQEH